MKKRPKRSWLKKLAISNWSLTQKVLFITAMVILASGLIGTFLQIKRLSDAVIETRTRHVTAYARQIEKIIGTKKKDLTELENDLDLNKNLRLFAKTEGIDEFFIIDANYRIIAHNKKGEVGKTYSNPDVTEAINNNQTVVKTETHPEKEGKIQRLDIAVPLREAGKVVGAVEVELPLSFLETQTNSFITGMLFSTLIICLIILPLMVLYLFKYVSKPLREVVAATQEIGKGDLSVRLDVAGDDEVSRLASSLNKMAFALQHSTENLKHRLEELSILSEVSKATSSTLDLDKVLNLVLEDAIKALHAQAGSIMLLNESKGELRIKVARGLGYETIKKTRVKLGEGISGWVAESGEPLLLIDGVDDPRFDGVRGGIKDAVCVPLKTKEKIIGVVNVNDKKEKAFTSSDVNLLSTLANQAAGAIENAQLFETLHNVYLSTIEALAAAIDAKDPYTHGHSSRVAHYSREIAKMLDLPSLEVEAIQAAAYLHDIGKIGISERILLKVGRLNREEYTLIQTHPEIAAKILSPIQFPWEVLSPIRHHHESIDGGGYPRGTKGDEISLGGKIIAVADAFDAMTSSRPYRSAFSLKDAIEELKRYSGKQFDPRVVDAFLNVLERKLKKLPKP